MKIKSIKDTVKSKVKKVVGKVVGKKVVKKCGKKVVKNGCVIIGLIGLTALAGCGSNPAAYSVTQNNEFTRSIIIIASRVSVSNEYVTAEGNVDAPSIELFQAAQNLENKGTQSADQRSTNEIKPDTDVNVGGVGGGSGKGILEQAVGAVAGLCSGGSSSGSSSGSCSDGSCSDGSCSDGDCCEGQCSE